ncbi:two-component regulator propeller domain-containing protein [Aquimarina sp. SS2-1]|uniref:ligand-binding sensor domain-containing protein n=1 Tax=Aquimarina besae TaxID=3342247 RepID=UPI00366D31A9
MEKNVLPLLIFAHFFALSQQNVIHYSTADGLPHDVTYGIFQDTKGYVWIGTDDGLSKFDGKEFKNYTTNDGLTSNYIIDINELSDSKLVLATWRGGINILNPKTGKVLSNSNSPHKIGNLRILNDTIYNIHNKHNNIYWLFDKEIKFKTEAVKQKEKSTELNITTRIDKRSTAVQYNVVDDTLYAFSACNLTFPVKGIFTRTKNKFHNKFSFLNTKVITAFTKTDSIYIAANNENLLFFNNNEILQQHNIKVDGLSIIKILQRSKTELIVLAVDHNGFKYPFYYNLENKITTDLRDLYNIKSTISDILIDRENNLWMSTYGEGIYYISSNKNQFNVFQTDTNIIDIAFLKNKTYLTSNYKLLILDSLKQLEKEIKLNGFVKDLFVSNDTILVGSLEFKNSIDTDKVKETYARGFYKTPTFGMILLNDSIRLLDKQKSYYYPRLDYNIFDAFEYKKRLLFGTNKGMYWYNPIGNIVEEDSLINSIVGKQVINSGIVISDTLFLGTNEGLIKVYNDHVIQLTEKNGLLNNRINCITADHKGKIWIGTQKGLSVLEKGNFINFNQKNGLGSTYIRKVVEDDNYYIWATGNKGVSILDNKKSLVKSKPPEIEVFRSGLSFYYNAITFNTNAPLVQYQINNSDWIQLDKSEGVLNFDDYKSGVYSLKIRSKNLDSIWKETNVYNFEIKLPWYKTWWIISLISLLSCLIIIIFILYRLKKTRQKNIMLQRVIERRNQLENELVSVRNNIAQDFHDDLGNKLARISIFSNLLNEDKTSIKKEDKELLQQIISDSNYLFKGTKDFIFSLQSQSDYLEEVVTYLSDFGEEYLHQFDIIFEVEKSISHNVKLPYYWSKQLIFIFKEAITNAVKHSRCRKICLHFNYEEDILTIICRDDGIGFETEGQKRVNGLENIKRRAAKINGKLFINSEISKGTEVYFSGKTTQNV